MAFLSCLIEIVFDFPNLVQFRQCHNFLLEVKMVSFVAFPEMQIFSTLSHYQPLCTGCIMPKSRCNWVAHLSVLEMWFYKTHFNKKLDPIREHITPKLHHHSFLVTGKVPQCTHLIKLHAGFWKSCYQGLINNCILISGWKCCDNQRNLEPVCESWGFILGLHHNTWYMRTRRRCNQFMI